MKQCDLLIVMGTSLQVQPFAGMINKVPSSTPRILVNREAVGPFTSLRRQYSGSVDGDYEEEEAEGDSGGADTVERFIARIRGEALRSKDMLFLGDADEAAWTLAKTLGWEDELKGLIERGNATLVRKWKEEGDLLGAEDATGRNRKGERSAESTPNALAADIKRAAEPELAERYEEDSEDEEGEEDDDSETEKTREVDDEDEDVVALQGEFRVRLGI